MATMTNRMLPWRITMLNLDKLWLLYGCIFLVAFGIQETKSQLLESEFQPTVTAMCKPGFMNIRVNFNQSFVGTVHSRGYNKDYRRPPCMATGNASNSINLKIDLFAIPDSPEYCGIVVNNRTDERSISLAVRIHKTLELADDKFYVITCGNTKYRNARNETSLVSLRLLDSATNRRVQEAIFGHNYTLRAEISPVDLTYGFKVKSCLGFDTDNHNVTIVDERGCPDKSRFISKFVYDRHAGTAEATLSAFRFSDTQKQLHLQCEIVLCKETCGEPVCDGDDNALAIKGQANPREEEALLHAGTSVYVLNPGDTPMLQPLCEDGIIHPSWLLWLAIALGILLLIMFIINVFLCSAMTCSCARTEIIEKEPSIIEDYDPYRSWHGSQYGSRYSLNGKPGYTSGGSTMNSTRSISTNSDHYAIVHSRPGSRYSGPHNKQHHHHRGPSSNLGSHYSAK
ncbi:uncharacterized protein LOC106652449 isoform X1 [Trichogramma pretiosum]|uniref:uncharacterized protein LOC106652449 isoform X1 n=1 Tax=Trichogramma pretiosum TaxID=7493 RepID=UPI0006C9CDB8|nr:uncharacterized protein LOC106652449 isoform X1 [Trichogramma pretiosum]XP_014226894.1 uncharacterized protein LOC106652449 isoform X1 [Trichogramma pretiosum]XP_023315442.1 uncharacterized protein LOC106652449 isoform X1 [Trichogramma pretiosum]